MIATLHTFGRDLKWSPHIHALVPELIYNPDKNEIKTSEIRTLFDLQSSFFLLFDASKLL